MRPVTLTTSDASGAAKNSSVCPMDLGVTPTNISLVAVITGAATYSVQYTLDDVFSPTFDQTTAKWNDVTTMSGIAVDGQGTIVSPVTGIRLRQTAGAGSVSLRITQAGIGT